jgi:hypothetical protein
MKKIILTLLVIILFSVSASAEDQKTTDTAPETQVTSTTSQETATPPSDATETTQTEPAASADAPPPPAADMKPEKKSHSFGHKLLFYIPNRFLDTFDFVRLRVRVGPGFALGARVTKPISFFFGGYGSVYVGLPGPRLKPTVKLPIGLENYGGLSLSLLDSTNEGRFAPNYSPTEIGFSWQFLVVGSDVDLDPVEIIDLALGFLFIDIRGDDL